MILSSHFRDFVSRLLLLVTVVTMGECNTTWQRSRGQHLYYVLLKLYLLIVRLVYLLSVCVSSACHLFSILVKILTCGCFLCAEYMPGGSLYDYLHTNHNVLKLSQLLKFAIDVCRGMEYLHQNDIIHRDLKTANLLMDTENVRIY